MSAEPSSEQDELEKLAYSFWEERGRPLGSAEVDWSRAEQEAFTQTAQDEQRIATHSHSEGGISGGWSESASPSASPSE